MSTSTTGTDEKTTTTDILPGTGIIKGKTVDATTGDRLFGVVVELVGTGRSYVTSPTGYFKMTDLPEGVYVMRFTVAGYAPVEESVSLIAGETLDLEVELDRAA
jgi:hypothetical protein